MKLKYTKRLSHKNISAAQPFKHDLEDKINVPNFKKVQITDQQLIQHCEEITPKVYSGNDLTSFFLTNPTFFGPKRYIKDEVTRVAKNSDVKELVATLSSFPFKCPVPIKTNYHNLPDLGELIFLNHLAEICKQLKEKTGVSLKITVLEETEALAPVFEVDKKTLDEYNKRIDSFLELLELKDNLTFVSLRKVINNKSFDNYQNNINSHAIKIKQEYADYKELFEQVLPTIALSLNTNNLTLNQSQEFIKRIFNNNASKKINNYLLETAARYIAFITQESNFLEEKYKDYLHLSICAKSGRVGIRPPMKILPHHSVPVIYIKGKKKKFQVEYFIDFIKSNFNKKILEVSDLKGNFLYYQVGEEGGVKHGIL